MVKTWLEGTLLLIYQQVLRDHPWGTFAELKEGLRGNFGQPLDVHHAVHKLKSGRQREGQSLVQLVMERFILNCHNCLISSVSLTHVVSFI